MANDIQIKGLDRLQHKLAALADPQKYAAAMDAAATHVKGKIAKYPPSSEANRPNDVLPWYERGYGTRYPGGGGRKTSQTLGRKWTIAKRGTLARVVGNNVSYGPFVQGERQAWFHKRRGWKTTETVAKEERKTVVEFLQKKVREILERRA